jgi:hypothetical protein
MVTSKILQGAVCALIVLAFSLTTNAQDKLYASFLKPEARPVASQPAQPIPKVGRKESKGFWKPYGGAFKASTAVYVTGAVLDAVSTRRAGQHGAREANPLLRNPDGSPNVVKAVALKSALYGLTLWLEQRSPRAASWIRFVVGGAQIGAAAHNFRQ